MTFGPGAKPLLTAVGIAVFFFLVFYDFFDGSCSSETSWICAREWIGALSGWIAALAAFFTIIPLWNQLAEMKRQTQSVIGNDPPTIEFKPNDMLSSGRFRIVNWNRRTLYICEARWKSDIAIYTFSEISSDDTLAGRPEPPAEVWSLDGNGSLKRPLAIPGWDNPGGAPFSKDLALQFGIDSGHSSESELRRINARLELIGYLAGHKRERVVLVAEAPVLDSAWSQQL